MVVCAGLALTASGAAASQESTAALLVDRPLSTLGKAPFPAPTLTVPLSIAELDPARGTTLAHTPPMGWNGYNRYQIWVNEAVVEAEARALVSSGMKAAGYNYVNLDGGWDLPWRDAHGNLVADPIKFPHGIRAVADYVHSLGLKFGLYVSAGYLNCRATSAGSYGHYAQDAALFASWQVDYLKFDWCYVPFRTHPELTQTAMSQKLATEMSQALIATERPIVFDANDPGYGPSGPWARGFAHLWRTAPDIEDRYSSMVRSFRSNVNLFAQAGPGGWNDPDMLEIGNGGMTFTEYRSQFSLWAEMAAPLIAGNDLTHMTAATQSILTNKAVIAVDQDPAGRQGYPVSSAGGMWVLTKPLANGDRALVLFNETNRPASISVTMSAAGLPRALEYRVVDLWTGGSVMAAAAVSETVAPHSVMMFRVSPVGNWSHQFPD